MTTDAHIPRLRSFPLSHGRIDWLHRTTFSQLVHWLVLLVIGWMLGAHRATWCEIALAIVAIWLVRITSRWDPV